jgi:hypothetical protein
MNIDDNPDNVDVRIAKIAVAIDHILDSFETPMGFVFIAYDFSDKITVVSPNEPAIVEQALRSALRQFEQRKYDA